MNLLLQPEAAYAKLSQFDGRGRQAIAVPDFGPANGEINQAILAIFRERDIVIPFPQRQLRLLKYPAAMEY